jgi:hypothetical protein
MFLEHGAQNQQEVTGEGLVRFKEIGSGVLISADGKVATAAHVVQHLIHGHLARHRLVAAGGPVGHARSSQ